MRCPDCRKEFPFVLFCQRDRVKRFEECFSALYSPRILLRRGVSAVRSSLSGGSAGLRFCFRCPPRSRAAPARTRT